MREAAGAGAVDGGAEEGAVIVRAVRQGGWSRTACSAAQTGVWTPRWCYPLHAWLCGSRLTWLEHGTRHSEEFTLAQFKEMKGLTQLERINPKLYRDYEDPNKKVGPLPRHIPAPLLPSHAARDDTGKEGSCCRGCAVCVADTRVHTAASDGRVQAG